MPPAYCRRGLRYTYFDTLSFLATAAKKLSEEKIHCSLERNIKNLQTSTRCLHLYVQLKARSRHKSTYAFFFLQVLAINEQLCCEYCKNFSDIN